MPENVDEIAAEWCASTEGDAESKWSRLDDAPYDAPEVAWAAILRALELPLTEKQIAVLAAGPLETLLSNQGGDFIERVEHEAAINARFNHLLGGVWRLGMSEEVWGRVKMARRETW